MNGLIDWSQQVTPESRAAKARAAKFEALGAYASAKRDGGISLGGVSVSTSEKSRNMIASTVAARSLGTVSFPLEWHENDDWTELSEEQFLALAGAVTRHVQACFGALRVAQAAMADLEDPSEFDLEAALDAAYAEKLA